MTGPRWKTMHKYRNAASPLENAPADSRIVPRASLTFSFSFFHFTPSTQISHSRCPISVVRADSRSRVRRLRVAVSRKAGISDEKNSVHSRVFSSIYICDYRSDNPLDFVEGCLYNCLSN